MATGLAVPVAQGDLALGVGGAARAGRRVCAVRPGAPPGDGRNRWGRHQHAGLIGGVAEHQALVARALLVISLSFTPMAMSGDCLPMAFSTAQEAPSKPTSELL